MPTRICPAFQDADESAFYEFICRRAGINIEYCNEQFENDGSSLSAILKGIKRAMAGEYSRELSVKTFAGQAHVFRLGFRPGGTAMYATRRLLVDQLGKPKHVLKSGEHKYIQTDRVVLILGPPQEVRIVRWIFSTFVTQRKTEREIAECLNKKGISSGVPRPWTYARIRQTLKNEIYLGNSIWNRTSFKLAKKRWSHFLRQPAKVDSPMQRTDHHEDAETVFG